MICILGHLNDNNNTVRVFILLILRCSQLFKRLDVFFRNAVYLYALCNKAANRNSLFASQVVFEVVTSGHPGYVAIDEVKVLGHPCSKYLLLF